MHTRGKGLVVNDGAVQQDVTTEEDANSDQDNEEASQCKVNEEKGSLSSRPGSANRSRRTPTPSRNSGSISPVLGQTRNSRSATRKGQFVSNISTEDTPLSQRHAEITETKSKRLTLFKPHEPLLEEQSPQHLDETKSSSSEEKDQIQSKDNSQSFVEESEKEKQENVRRSTRHTYIKSGTYNPNDSWITSHKPAKGYPTLKEESNGRVRGSKRHSARRRSSYVDNDEEEEGEEDDLDDRRGKTRGKSASMKGKMKRSSSSKYSTHRSQEVMSSPSKDNCLYTRVKTRRPQSSVTYSEYGSTVTNAKKTPAKRQSAYELRRRYQHESTESSSSMSQSSSEDEEEEEQVAASPNKESRKMKSVNQSTEAEGQEEQNMSERGGEMIKGQYPLRKRQPKPVARFGTEVKDSRSNTPPRSRANRFSERNRIPCSPAHRPVRKRRQKAQNESTTSSSSSDEERFERRKNKSMVKARNRCLPMNFTPDDLGQGVVKDRMKIGSSLADVDPMKIDQNVNFEQVGGLETYIRSLKEMILFPLLYPEVFQKFSIQAPRGVLFYGPPGTGKTLVARCLANECSQKDRRVAFFMRKGADCLSKWVGESERQLRLLFDQAFQMRPSIIFFDEIDGLAPVRSTRQDQIHSSIVSTLLALMDGLDSRGEVIIIGATNRLDAIDPALRRPGRFDREFHFPLPSMPARKEILDIHLKSWNPSPPSDLVEYLSQKTVGYCGADLKALCAEAALLALRRRYPQVYESKDKLLLDMSEINVDRRDFDRAIQRLVPASQRSSTASGKPLSVAVSPLLSSILNDLIQKTRIIFAEGVATLKLKGPLSGVLKQTSNQLFPRLLVLGDSCSHTASALLHFMERLPVHRLDLSTLNGLSVRSPEEACVQLFQEARRNVPAVIYLPLVNRWWPVVGETVRATLLTQLTELDAELPILLLATDETNDWESLPDDLRDLFHEEDGEVFHTRPFTDEERRNFFKPLLLEKCLKPPTVKKPSDVKLEVLPLAPAPPPRQLNTVEKERLERKEEATLRELRIFLREVLAKMARNKLFFIFTRPVDLEEVPDYLNIIRQPMDLETMMTKIDQHLYESAKDFLADIELICSNALEYNPDRKPEDKQIRHRACTLRDTAYALIKAEMDTDFEEQCQEISRTRKAREGKVVPISFACTSGPSTKEAGGSTPLDGEAKPINGEATKSEIRSAIKKRKTTSSWANGNARKSVSKKRKICDATDQLNGSLTSNESMLATSLMETSEVIATGDAAVQNPLKDGSTVKEDGEFEKEAEVEEEKEQEQIEEATDVLDSDEAIEVETNAISTDSANIKSKKKTVSIDVERLEKLLESFVSATENWRLEKLLRLYSKLARLVDRYSKLYDRVPLIQEMEQMASRLNIT